MVDKSSNKIFPPYVTVNGKKYFIDDDILTIKNESIDSIENIQGLDSLANLKRLLLEHTNITSIKGLSSIKGLEYLSLEHNEISHIQNLDNLENLKVLALTSNKIEKIQGLENLINLEELYISDNPINRLEGIALLPKLHEIEIEHSNLESIEKGDLPRSIQCLRAQRNKITRVYLPSMSACYLAGNKINTVELEPNARFDTLDVRDNEIVDLDWLENLRHADYLGWGQNLIDTSTIPERFYDLRVVKHSDQ